MKISSNKRSQNEASGPGLPYDRKKSNIPAHQKVDSVKIRKCQKLGRFTENLGQKNVPILAFDCKNEEIKRYCIT